MIGVTVHKYFDPFKVMVKQAVKEGYLEKDPFQFVDLGIRATKGKRVYLEVEERAMLKNVHIPTTRPDLAMARDHWLFCFYASFYYSDLRALQWDQVKKTEHGYCIVGERFKNENSFIAPIHKFSNAIDILERQRGKSPLLVFPDTISEQKYNAKLKELAQLAGIDKNIMNKSARHSAIQFWESQGLETQHMAKMAGHTKESTTKEYYDLSTRDINHRVARFDFSKLDV
jgi:integrase